MVYLFYTLKLLAQSLLSEKKYERQNESNVGDCNSKFHLPMTEFKILTTLIMSLGKIYLKKWRVPFVVKEPKQRNVYYKKNSLYIWRQQQYLEGRHDQFN